MPEAKTIPAKYVFLEIVDFTLNRSVEAQTDIIQALNSIVASSVKEYGVPKENVLFVPAGNGLCVALLNIESPYDIHLLIALSILREIARYNTRTTNEMRKFEVRAGLNANTDNLVTDINGRLNIAGEGLNTASRIMQFAGGNQILVSNAVFESLRCHEKYISSFKNFRGEIPVHQFIENGYEGLNTAIPEFLQMPAKTETQPIFSPSTAAAAPPTEKPARVGQVEFTKQPSVTKTPAPMQRSVTPLPSETVAEISLPEKETAQTQSYLTGILAEQANQNETGTQTKTGWIKPKPQQMDFLEDVVPREKTSPLMWTLLIVLLIAILGVASWIILGGRGNGTENTNAEQQQNTQNSAAGNTNLNTKPAGNTKPGSSQANKSVSSLDSETEAPELTAQTTNNLESDQSFVQPQPISVKEEIIPTVKNEVETPRRKAIIQSERRQLAPQRERPVTRKISKPAPPQKQIAKSPKPKPSAKITLDDLINSNR